MLPRLHPARAPLGLGGGPTLRPLEVVLGEAVPRLQLIENTVNCQDNERPETAYRRRHVQR